MFIRRGLKVKGSQKAQKAPEEVGQKAKANQRLNRSAACVIDWLAFLSLSKFVVKVGGYNAWRLHWYNGG
jgi:hypothetical protein